MLRTDLKIFKPERIGNEDNAGGQRTSIAIVNGKLNDVFSSISDIDHARSSFDIVKLYPALSTSDQSKLQDAHIFLSDQPADSLVNVLLVEAQDLKDTDTVAEMLKYLSLSSTKFHGTSLLVDDAPIGTELKVELVNRSLTPTVKMVNTKIGLKPSISSIFKEHRILSYGMIHDVNIDLPDFLLSKPIFYGEYQRYTSADSGRYGVYTFELEQSDFDLVDGVISNKNRIWVSEGQYFTLFYLSSDEYRFHSFTADGDTLVLATGERVLPGYTYLKKTGSSEIYVDDKQGRFIANGYVFATIDYDTGEITDIDGVDYSGTVEENLGSIISKSEPSTTTKNWQLPSSSFVRDSLYISFETTAGAASSASSDSDGNITGENCTGSVSSTGYVSLTFSQAVKPASISYDYDEIEVTTVESPPDSFDTSKLPNNGVVAVFHEFNPICIQYRERTEIAALANNQTISVLADANFIDVVDNNGLSLWSASNDNYSYDSETGEVTINTGVSDFTGPFIITAILSELALVSDISGNTLNLLTPLNRSYPAGSAVSSVQVLGDFQAQSKDERTLAAWQNNFADTGAAASSAINTTQYPIELVNIGAIAQRWAVVFTSTTAYKVVGEHVGNIYSGDILNDCAPINQLLNEPYFIIRKEAFGEGLNPGEAFLFETLAASKPTILTRSVSPGHSEIERDNSTLSLRGNKD